MWLGQVMQEPPRYRAVKPRYRFTTTDQPTITSHRASTTTFWQHAKLQSPSRIMLLAAKHQMAHILQGNMGTRCCFWICRLGLSRRLWEGVLPRDTWEDVLFGWCLVARIKPDLPFNAPCDTVSCCCLLLFILCPLAAGFSFLFTKDPLCISVSTGLISFPSFPDTLIYGSSLID